MGFSCSSVELGAKFNANSLLLNIRHFDISRHKWKRCKENGQNSETRTLIKTQDGWLTAERYSKRHLAAQVRSANGLRGIFKFSEILGSNSYTNRSVWNRCSSVGLLNRLQAGTAGTPIHWVPGPCTGTEATGASRQRSFAPSLPSSVDFKNEWGPCSQPPLWNCLFDGLPTLDGLIASFHVNLCNCPTSTVVEDKHAGTKHDTFSSGGLPVLEMIIVYCLHDPLYSQHSEPWNFACRLQLQIS